MPSEFDFDASTVPRPQPDHTAANPAAGPPDPPAGTRFRPTEKLGQGGQGEVWLALDPELDRHVALKVVRRDRLGSDEIREKLRLEAEVAGKLEHPNIVAVYEVGRQQLGDDPAQGDPPPYCVMRFYRKHTLKEAVEEFHDEPWSEPKFRELLLRFIDVCNAVAYAHSRGVLHRDLKPENVMLGEFGETLLVDWGLAKIVGRDEIHKTIDGAGTMQLDRDPNATTAGSIKGTLRYMSPEQARGEVATLAQPTDVYGLGAILYHMLTGRPPVDPPIDDDGLDLHEVLQHVREGRIDPPRDRNPQVPRALQAICLQALSLKPLDRYRSAVALADDVTRWLNDEPVTAYRDPLLTRSRRWLRRHQALAASSAVAVLVGLLALSALLVMVRINNDRLADANADLQQANQRESVARREAQENEREANRQQKLAEANERNAEEQSKLAAANAATAHQQTQLAIGTLNTVIFDIQRGLENVPGAGEVRRKLLGTALERLRQISDEFGDADVVDRQTSIVLMEMADTVLRVGMAEKELEIGGVTTQSPVEFALSLYQRASENLARLAASDPTNTQAQEDLSISYNSLGKVMLQAGEVLQALESYQQSLEIRERLAAADPTNAQVQRALSISYNGLGDVLLKIGEVHQALQSYSQGLEISEWLAPTDSTDAQAQRDLSISYDRLGDVLLKTGEAQQALRLYRQSLEIRERLAAADHTNARAQRDLSLSYFRLGDVLLETGEVQQALRSYRKSLEVCERLAAADPTDRVAQRDRSVSYNKLGDVLLQTGEVQQALQSYGQGREISERLAVADPNDAQAQRDLVFSCCKLGDAQREMFAYDEAASQYNAAIAVLDAMIDRGQNPAQSQRERETLELRVQGVKFRIVARGEWESVLARPAEQLPVLLCFRFLEMAKQNRLDDAAKAAAKLRELAPADQLNLYLAACGYAACVKAGKMGEAADSTAEQQKRLGKWTGLCLECLKEAIAAGFDFKQNHMNDDFSAVCDLPEFKALLPADSRGDAGGDGLEAEIESPDAS